MRRDGPRALVLGGAGFLGSHLVESLLGDGYRVTVVDSMRFCHQDNLSSVQGSPALNLVVADCTDQDWDIVEEFDEAYHLAGVVATRDFMAQPVAAFWTSVLPLHKLLLAKRRRPELKLLFASSSEVYGDPLDQIQRETDRGNVSCNGPRSGYDEGKRGGEALIAGWRHEEVWPVAAAVVRIFNTYGPRMTSNGRLVPSMVCRALRDGEIMVNAPGTQTRTLQYVDDCIIALRRAMLLQSPLTINIGGHETLTVNEVAERIAAATTRRTGRPVQVVYGPTLPDEVYRRRPDLMRAQELLDWQARITLEDGLTRVIDYWRNRWTS